MSLLTPATRLALKAKFFRGLAEPSRLAILEALLDGPRTVSELVAATGLSQPNASAHLACLRDCGLVVREARGRHAYYRLADERVARLLRLADEILAEVALGVYLCTHIPSPEGGSGREVRADRAASP